MKNGARTVPLSHFHNTSPCEYPHEKKQVNIDLLFYGINKTFAFYIGRTFFTISGAAEHNAEHNFKIRNIANPEPGFEIILSCPTHGEL